MNKKILKKVLLMQQLIVNAKHLLNNYLTEDETIDSLCKLYAEYYNNLLKPLMDSRELARGKLVRTEKKLTSQGKTSLLLPAQSNCEAFENLKSLSDSLKEDVYGLSNNIDLLYVDYKQNLIQFYGDLMKKMRQDREKFIHIGMNLNLTGFIDILTKERRNR